MDQSTTTAGASPPYPATNGSSSKSPEEGTGGFVAHTKMAVQPPKKEDLQKSYATTVTDEANPKGWYGSMSKSSQTPHRILVKGTGTFNLDMIASFWYFSIAD